MKNMSTSESDLDPVSMLKWYVECGVDECISETPTNWFEITEETQVKQVVTQDASAAPKPVQRPASPAPLASQKENIETATKLAQNAKTLDELKAAILDFEGCSLKKTASNIVFCDGNPDSDIMLIGESPGGEEDKIGKPFIGEAGALLDKMFAAIDMTREKDFYITNVLPWRPPGNRKPTDAECEMVLPFLIRHIELFKPKMIILIGGTSANALLNTQSGITKLRGKWQEYSVSDVMTPMVPIFHPAYLIRQPQFKKQTWHDLLVIKEKIKELK